MGSDLEVLPDFEMEMGGVNTMGGADGADLLPPLHRLVEPHRPAIEVRIDAVGYLKAAFGAPIRMTEDHQIAP